MTNNFILPEKWCIKITEENRTEVKKWFTILDEGRHNYAYSLDTYYHFPELNKAHDLVSTGCSKRRDYTEIAFEQFEKYILNKETPVEDYNYLIPILKKLNIQ